MWFGFDGLNYMGAPVLERAKSLLAVLVCQVVLMGAIGAHPVNGGPFDGPDLDLEYPSCKGFHLLGLNDGRDVAAKLKVKHIRNGRLVMFSMSGHYVQAAVAGQGPVENGASYIADLLVVNRLIFEIVAQYTPSVAMFAAAGMKKAAAPQVDLSDW